SQEVALPFGRYEDRTPTHGCAEARGGRGLEHEAVAAIGVSVLGSDYPYVVLVNVGLAELENLSEWVRGVPNESHAQTGEKAELGGTLIGDIPGRRRVPPKYS